MDREKLVEELLATDKDEGDKARAISSIIAADIEQETEHAKLEAEEKKSRKERFLGYLKIAGTVFVALFSGFVAIFNARSVMKFEETGTIRTKAWTGVKPEKTQEIK